MIILLSPSKKLLPIVQPYQKDVSTPIFQTQTNELALLMKQLSVPDIKRLMAISHDLALLNYDRYQAFETKGINPAHQYPAVYIFRGDVYSTLNADTWDPTTLSFAQSHLLILSGLYGLLKPLDLIQPYRLEMGTRLANSRGKTLYDFWKSPITTELNQRLTQQAHPCLINLASIEYASAIDTEKIAAPIITIHFKERRENELKVIGIHAKKARGAMANYLISHHIQHPSEIRSFSLLGYQFCKTSSDEANLIFIR